MFAANAADFCGCMCDVTVAETFADVLRHACSDWKFPTLSVFVRCERACRESGACSASASA